MLIQAACASGPVFAQEVGSYLNGGIGQEGRQAMHAQRAHYNLRLRFAQLKTGAYLGAVDVTIEPQASKGGTMHYADAGPFLYVHLHPGSYRVSAVYEGKKQVRTVQIGKSAAEEVMYWH